MLVSRRVRRLLQLVPGKQRLKKYRFLPFFFLLGEKKEWIMINVRVGKKKIYDVYRRKRKKRQYEARMEKRE
ncbi:SMIM4 protein, partial [Crotophaga sulcirostris]|nr:SMIM4 protein [Crotophaga sulcirostris]